MQAAFSMPVRLGIGMQAAAAAVAIDNADGAANIGSPAVVAHHADRATALELRAGCIQVCLPTNNITHFGASLMHVPEWSPPL